MRYNYKPGDEILTSYPFVHVIESDQRGILCDHCLNRQEKLLRCSRCKITYFCDRSCQVAAWPDHKVECTRLKEVAPKVPSPAARQFAKILVKLKERSPTEITESIFTQKRSFHDLMSNVEHIEKDPERMEQFMQLWCTVRTFIGEEWLPPVEMGLEIFGKMVINSYSICDYHNYDVGTGLYIGPSIFDHSCAPNAQAVFDGRKMILRAIRNIACDTLDDIRICYVDLLELQRERAAKLRQQYYFDCDCSRCAADQKAEYLEEKSPALTAEARALWTALRQLGAPSQADYERFRESAERFLKANVLPENDIGRVKARELASYCCIRCGKFDNALDHLFARVNVYRKCYGMFHPSYGVLLYSIAKILHYNGNLQDALKYFKEASDVITVSHGNGHPLFRELSEAMMHCTLEADATNETH
ncbi:histone-lysine N-methyltransferase SMYD3-like isoform X2 [Ornithodoros turicata]|uniref:histone-lysine N-methyltransferase SMYD3-like isoform X2 n=1 Tax=Ornithodoros turicata TaxID=34597 RepID=UPI0031392EC6